VIIAALGSDGLFENVPTLSPPAGFATGPFAKAEFGNNYPSFIAQVAGHRQRTGKPLILNERAPICLDSRRRPLSGCSNTLSRNRTYEKFYENRRLNESSKDLKRRLASNVS
jgi:hypothetical protein